MALRCLRLCSVHTLSSVYETMDEWRNGPTGPPLWTPSADDDRSLQGASGAADRGRATGDGETSAAAAALIVDGAAAGYSSGRLMRWARRVRKVGAAVRVVLFGIPALQHSSIPGFEAPCIINHLPSFCTSFRTQLYIFGENPCSDRTHSLG